MATIPVRTSEINDFLRELHQPSDHVGLTMAKLIAFPTTVASVGDADIVDLAVEMTNCSTTASDAAEVTARVRYATGASAPDTFGFYLNEFDQVGVEPVVAVEPGPNGETALEAELEELGGCEYRVTIDDRQTYRFVLIEIRYDTIDYRDALNQFAGWHEGAAPIPAGLQEPTGFGIETFGSGRRAQTVVLYTTHYACGATSTSEMRLAVTERLDGLDWVYSEPQKGSLFLHDGPFEAEAHVYGDDSRSQLQFVGEFQLR